MLGFRYNKTKPEGANKMNTIYLETRYHGATDTKGARVSVGVLGNAPKLRVQFAYNYAARNPHEAAIREFMLGNKIACLETIASGKRGNVYRVEYSNNN